MKVNGIEFEFDASDSACIEKFEKALDKMGEAEKALGEKHKSGKLKQHEFLKGYCELLSDFFVNATGTDVLKGITSVNKATQYYYDLLNQIKESGQKTMNLISKYDPKRIK